MFSFHSAPHRPQAAQIMPRPHLSPAKRLAIAAAAKFGSQRKVARAFGVTQSTVSYCVSQASFISSLAPSSPSKASICPVQVLRTPRPPLKLEIRALRRIKRIYGQNPWLSLQQVRQQLILAGMPLHKNTLLRARRLLGLKSFRAVRKPYLSPQGKAQRLRYALDHRHKQWRKVIFTDETILQLDHSHRVFVTRPHGQAMNPRFIQYTFRSGVPGIMVCGAIWHGGKSKLVAFDTSESTGKRKGVTSAIYLAQITKIHLLDIWRRVRRLWLGYGTPWIVEDNAPIHRALKTRGAAEEMGMRFLPHPPCSPCLNPIEHVWNYLKRKLDEYRPAPSNSEEMFEVASKLWDDIPQSYIDRLIDSMVDRIEAVIKVDGGYIPY